jgi:hypothetical protein
MSLTHPLQTPATDNTTNRFGVSKANVDVGAPLGFRSGTSTANVVVGSPVGLDEGLVDTEDMEASTSGLIPSSPCCNVLAIPSCNRRPFELIKPPFSVKSNFPTTAPTIRKSGLHKSSVVSNNLLSVVLKLSSIVLFMSSDRIVSLPLKAITTSVAKVDPNSQSTTDWTHSSASNSTEI